VKQQLQYHEAQLNAQQMQVAAVRILSIIKWQISSHSIQSFTHSLTINHS